MQLSSLNIEHFFDLPALVFLKDRLGKYHACNDYVAKQAGLEKGQDIIGTTDFDHCWKSEAPFFQLMDKKAIDEEQPIMFIENIPLADQNTFKALTYKLPIYTCSQKIMVFGISFFLNREDSIPELLHGMKIPLNIKAKQIIHCNKINSNSIISNRFTHRQAQCLYLLVKGMTAGQIADEIGLSKRTVESYTATLKDKLSCASKSELIKKAWELDFIKEKLFNDK